MSVNAFPSKNIISIANVLKEFKALLEFPIELLNDISEWGPNSKFELIMGEGIAVFGRDSGYYMRIIEEEHSLNIYLHKGEKNSLIEISVNGKSLDSLEFNQGLQKSYPSLLSFYKNDFGKILEELYVASKDANTKTE